MGSTDCVESHETKPDSGFSLAEMVIAVFLLATLALAILPLMLGATRSSGTNTDLVAANAFAGAQLAPIRESFRSDAVNSSCSALRTAYAKTGILGPTGSRLRADVTVGTCPATLPGTVSVTVRVYDSTKPSVTLVSLPTAILVGAA